MRVATKGSIKDSRQSLTDLLGAYKRAGLTHVMLDIRRDSLTEMLEALDVVTTDIRPAVDRG
jgi:hypothetical protein